MKPFTRLPRALVAGLIALGILMFLVFPAEGAYSIGFESERIEITSSDTSGLAYDQVFTVAGRSSLDQVWFCVRGPGGELATCPADVSGGTFRTDIHLRFGPGTYTVWAGDNPTRFDGIIRFEVINRQQGDVRYLTPSAYVDSDHPDVVQLAGSLVQPTMGELEKLGVIYGWVTGNLSYDY